AGSIVNNQVGVSVGTDSCNPGTVDLDWFALPSNDHPVIPQNVYRMSGGTGNNDRFEQIGESWLKHAFTAASSNTCGFGCNGVGGSHLGSGCSDLYSAGLNAGQSGLGSRAWVNPFTGAYPRGDSSTPPSNHTGHTHTAVSHRAPVNVSDWIGFLAYKVTNPSAGVWHYEYAVYNENLDRGIQSFSIPSGAGVNITNVGFHAPPQEPGWANDGTVNNLGYSSTPWSVTQD